MSNSRVLMRLTLVLAVVASVVPLAAAEPAPRRMVTDARRILFLGDSITAAGQYVAYFEAWLATQKLSQPPVVINCGLPSETVSGLSEEGHAGGKFPRPDLAERLSRVLDVAKPDLVFACYGINCGIYQPFEESRFERYQQGYRALKAAVEQRGAKFVAITPPFYDDQRSPKGFPYNAVLDRYSEWLLSQQKAGWTVIDLHGPMSAEVVRRRQTQPEFTFQPDGVHPNEEGHWFVASRLIAWCGGEAAAQASSPQEMLRLERASEALLPLVRQRMTVLRDAYVGAAGHKRPGVAAGLPLPEADEKAAELSRKIQASLATPR